MSTYILLIVAVFMNAFANISIKLGVSRLGAVAGIEKIDLVKKVIMNPWLVIGVSLFGATLVVYGTVLQKMNLSIAYPIMTSLGFLIVTIFSVLYFKETINGVQLMGLLAILLGIWMTTNP